MRFTASPFSAAPIADEPTSGLDSTASHALVAALRSVARERGMTTAAVIHQPSWKALQLFDDALLLGKGACKRVYKAFDTVE